MGHCGLGVRVHDIDLFKMKMGDSIWMETK